MSNQESFSKAANIPPWIEFDETINKFKLSDKAFKSEENFQTLCDYNHEWNLWQTAITSVHSGLVAGKQIDLNTLALRQAEWLKSMGWWKNKTHLESLMLVVSECGEAANEVRGEYPTDKFQTELADIILRTLGIAAENGIDIQAAVINKMDKNLKLRPTPERLK